MKKKRILGLLAIIVMIGLFIFGYICYSKFVMAHRMAVMAGCVIGFILLMYLQCLGICNRHSKRIDQILEGLQDNAVQNNVQSQPNKQLKEG